MIEEENTQAEVAPTFDMHGVFNKTTTIEPQAQEPEKKEPVKKELKLKEKQPVADQEDEESTPEKELTQSKPDETDYKSEYEKLQKTVKDTQRSFHEDRKKLSAYKKAVEKLKEEGSLLDEEATMLLDHTKHEDAPQEDTAFVKYCRVWDKELEYMKKYSPEPEQIDQHILAFQHLIQSSPTAEVNDILSDLAQYEDDEVELTKQMLEIGRQYNDDIYSDIAESGSIRKLKAKYAEKETEMQRKIDKLQKQVDKLKSQYEDYDKEPPSKLSSGMGNVALPSGATMEPSAIFAKQWQKR